MNYFEFEPVVQEEILLNDTSYLELRQPLCSKERNHLCNCFRRHHEEQFRNIILDLDQWFMRRCLKKFPIWSSCVLFFQQSKTVCVILIEGIMRNNSAKLF